VNPVDKTRTEYSINHIFYEQTYFSVVVESEMSTGYNQRYTEKTYKCLGMMHPFIVVGNPFTLKILHDDGFKTFHPFIDESYDVILDPKKRMEVIVKEIERLCNLSKSEWGVLLRDLEPILRHNKEVAEDTPMVKTNIDRILRS
jgi:hypothetical protein